MSEHDDNLDPTPEELAEAEALAASLDGRLGATPPAKPLAATALLRANRDGLGLSRDEAANVLARVEGSRRSSSRGVLRILLPASALAAAAAIAIVLLGKELRPRSQELPRPSMALLTAQSDAAHGSTQALDRAMQSYRRDVFANLRERYGAGR